MFPIEKLELHPKLRRKVVQRGVGMFINKAACKKFLLGHANDTRYHKFNRVESEVFDELNGILRQAMRSIVARNPSLGKTIRR
jgi:hypothetical protein